MNVILKAGLWSMSVGFGIAIGAAFGRLLIWLMILLKIG